MNLEVEIILCNTGDSRYVDIAYLDIITYVEVIFHSHLCRKRLT